MATILEAAYAVHLLFAGLWTGSVVFVTVGVLPSARNGSIEPEPLGTAFDRLRTISRASALLLLLTGGYMAGEAYTTERLTGTTDGHLVIAMILLWVVLAGLVEVGAGRVSDGVADRKVRDPGRSATRIHRIASLVSVGLLLAGGALSV